MSHQVHTIMLESKADLSLCVEGRTSIKRASTEKDDAVWFVLRLLNIRLYTKF